MQKWYPGGLIVYGVKVEAMAAADRGQSDGGLCIEPCGQVDVVAFFNSMSCMGI